MRELVETLQKHGASLKEKSRYGVEEYDRGICAFRGSLQGWIFEDVYPKSYPKKNVIAIDRRDCFDKIAKCPIQLTFPKNDRELAFLIGKIEWLLTPAGQQARKEYDIQSWVRYYQRPTRNEMSKIRELKSV